MFFSNEMEFLISCVFFGPGMVGAAGAVPESASIVPSAEFEESSIYEGVFIRICRSSEEFMNLQAF